MANRPTLEQLREGELWELPAAETLVEKLWPGARVVRNQPMSHIDLAVVRDGMLIAQLEVKRRFQAHDLYTTTMVAWEKHDAARFYRKYFRGSCFCLVVFDDRMGFFDLAAPPVGKKMMSRNDRENSERLYALYDLSSVVWQDELLPLVEAKHSEYLGKIALEKQKIVENDDIPAI